MSKEMKGAEVGAVEAEGTSGAPANGVDTTTGDIGEVGENSAGMTLSRRKFLKIIGQGSAATAVVATTGCAEKGEQSIFPNLKGDTEQIPGVAVWFSSTCTECSAGCGISVRTREGRAVKIEGNRRNPVGSGGLCALGQSSLQGLYDPDRVREPVKVERLVDSNFVRAGERRPALTPVAWDEQLDRVANRLKDNGKKKYLISGEVTGALAELLQDFCKAYDVEHVVYDPLQPAATARASKLVYGISGIPQLALDKAEVVVNFGADLFETHISPVEFARDWASTRRGPRPTKLNQIEPRLSVTGANADVWLAAAPGSELAIALYLLKFALSAGRGDGIRDDIRKRLVELTKEASLDAAVARSGVASEKIARLATELLEAKRSLVVSGGASTATPEALSLAVVVAYLNLVLGNVGTTVLLGAPRQTKHSPAALQRAIGSMEKGEAGLVMVYNTNPAHTLPHSFGLHFALLKSGLAVGLTSYLDETASLCDLVLPTNHGLESWGDSRPFDGQYGLQQPVMSQLWNTRSVGDVLLQLAERGGKREVAGGAKDFQGYLKNSWSKLHKSLGIAKSFEEFWLESLERGGYFDQKQRETRTRVTVSDDSLTQVRLGAAQSTDAELTALVYPTVKGFDGRGGNRPWLLELPDPITSGVWDTWAEMHPDTAAQRGIAKGDLVVVGNADGEVTVPVYVTPYVHRGVIALPMGNGHSQYGRFAKLIGGGNPIHLVSRALATDGVALALGATTVKVTRGLGRAELVKTMGSDSQEGRGLARIGLLTAAALANGKGEGHGEGEHSLAHHGSGLKPHVEHYGDGHHEAPSAEGVGHGESHGAHVVKQMYVQREHPLYRWGMAVDLTACTGCAACVVACYAENNIPVVGKEACGKGREMSWLRIERYFDGPADAPQVSFLPFMCQHCNNAPCEPVCPVYATYHNEEGLNAMVYNRCVGTRYCSNNCPYKVRRFNWHEYDLPEPMQLQMNPDVVKRSMGVMEKCTFCVQRISEGKDRAKDQGRLPLDGEIQPACVQSCPTQALTFGNLLDPQSRVSKLHHDPRAYKVLDFWINTQPAVGYLERVKYEV